MVRFGVMSVHELAENFRRSGSTVCLLLPFEVTFVSVGSLGANVLVCTAIIYHRFFWGRELLVELSDHFSQSCTIVNRCNSNWYRVFHKLLMLIWFVSWERVCLVCIFCRGFVTPTRTPQVGSSPRFVEVTEVTENSTVTTVGDVEEVNSDLSGPPTELEWVDPLSIQVTANTVEAPSSAMFEAFHQFQHNPQIQVWNPNIQVTAFSCAIWRRM